jgi:hypothetical protein
VQGITPLEDTWPVTFGGVAIEVFEHKPWDSDSSEDSIFARFGVHFGFGAAFLWDPGSPAIS